MGPLLETIDDRATATSVLTPWCAGITLAGHRLANAGGTRGPGFKPGSLPPPQEALAQGRRRFRFPP